MLSTARALHVAIFVPLLLLAGQIVPAAKAGNTYFDANSWKLIPAGNKTVDSLADLRDGVYLLELSVARRQCGPSGSGSGSRSAGIYTYTYMYIISTQDRVLMCRASPFQ